MKLTFLGAAGTVTGSKYLVESGRGRVLVDCGLFQGVKDLRLRNWDAPPVDPRHLDGVVLTHAHLDHCGYLPRLVKAGFRGPIWCTAPTRDLVGIILKDAAYLQEEDARYANRKGYSRHKPALPLYTAEDVEDCLRQLEVIAFDRPQDIDGLTVTFTPAGHIIGAACVRVEDKTTDLTFSGDIGRTNDPLMYPPRPLTRSTHLVCESTYGNRCHEANDPEEQLGEVVRRVTERGGVVLVPAFAVGRSQEILLLLARLKAARQIPDVPVYLNSPMAIEATRILLAHPEAHRLSPAECHQLNSVATYVTGPDESKALNTRHGPMVIIAGSGMATGGRILHHLKSFAPDPKNAILIVGFQAPGTRGDAIEHGAEAVKIHGQYVPVRAERVPVDGLSAHADQREIVAWLAAMEGARGPDRPRSVFLTHGEPAAIDTLRVCLRDELGWEARAGRDRETVELGEPATGEPAPGEHT